MKTLVQGLRYSLAALAMIFAAQAQAIPLEPGDANFTSDENGALSKEQVATIFGTSDLELLYKSNVGGNEEGPFAGSYDTAYSGDPNDALISYTGGDSIVCPECYLVVKDGAINDQYLFNLGSWDGMEELDLQDFYLGEGAISHVAIFGKSMVNVPEPSALILIGLGMIGLGMARRRVAH